MFRLLYLLNGSGGAVFAVLSIAFSMWMAYDCWKRNGDGYWLYLILFTGGIFALIYFFTQYWPTSRLEYGLWRWLTKGRRLGELEARAKQLKTVAAYEDLGREYYSLNRLDDAVATFRQALSVDEKSFEARVGLGYALLDLGKTEEAWPLLGKAYQEKPTHDEYRLVWMVARCLARRKKYGDAKNLYAFFLKQRGYSEARIEYAQLLADMGDLEGGKAALEELLAEIEFTPRYARRRERRWYRAAQNLLRMWEEQAAAE
jgi:hypothetical protein